MLVGRGQSTSCTRTVRGQYTANVPHRAVTAAGRQTWHGARQLNDGELLEPVVEKWSTELNLCAATLGPIQGGREGGPHRGSARDGGNSVAKRRRIVCSG
jgi:hypothetical protein